MQAGIVKLMKVQQSVFLPDENKEDTMKNKKILAILTIAAAVSMFAAGCNFGGAEPEEQVVVNTTPAPETAATPTPAPTIAPDVQDSTYTSSTGAVSIKLPDATWANKADEADMLSFESPEQGKILILHGQGEEAMSSAMLPDTEDLANALEQAADLVQGTDFTVENYAANDVEGVGVYTYSVRYTDPSKSGGYAYTLHKIYKSADEYYNICGYAVNDNSVAGILASIDSFAITGDSSLKAAAPAAGDTSADTAESTQGTDSTTQPDSTTSTGDSSGTISNSAGFTQEQLTDTNQTRTIYRNSDGHPIVITPDGNGNWVDFDGNTYRFANNEDVYDQNDVDYYWHGEGADVYYMPVE